MKVAIIMGSKSDLPIMSEAINILEFFNVDFDSLIVSAHRTPTYMYEFSNKAHENYDLIIAGAGGSAHLPGMVASLTHIPVIGVPIKSTNLNGIDSLLSIVQMPSGVPVATMAINGSKNAAILAVSILSLNDSKLNKKYINYRLEQTKGVLDEK